MDMTVGAWAPEGKKHVMRMMEAYRAGGKSLLPHGGNGLKKTGPSPSRCQIRADI